MLLLTVLYFVATLILSVGSGLVLDTPNLSNQIGIGLIVFGTFTVVYAMLLFLYHHQSDEG